ncbi:patatin-like phospholipase family protein [Accumulibacter sp.]|uniref:patatin-like phospholipase family protein n=1 Tax=Accumulibacter sp. TaxID=2053492 RepID=UPI0025E42AC7|nr:patatin-like phospholipase family protein [Accumulibacter sp.]MCM8611916.1 patatin-like phospholipase family protein [Accumulibacter sp.]MCM8635538.1 patatin-like phospholipase family protein [Accumulibacter sp.]MCM8639116.1 patatin-like phospholipase family protein [Accumulibacter sp.]
MTRPNRDEHLFSPGPKRILALDGGGIRGVLTVQILKRIESLLRERAGGDETFRLCDYFDLIGGTSTGAILAAGLATGMSAAELERLYQELGDAIFDPDVLRWGLLRAKFSKAPLEKALKRQFGDITLGDPTRIRTGLAIMLKRFDTGSPWVVHNNPRSRYFSPRPGGKALANSEFLLWQIVRASTAAPHYFDPEKLVVGRDAAGNDQAGVFVDGGVSPHNNPSLQLLMLAWLRGYALQWPAGAEKLLLVSCGTGINETSHDSDRKALAAADAIMGLASLMDDALALNEQLLQWMSVSPTARVIDREVGTLATDHPGGGLPLLTYLRYNAHLDGDWLRANVRPDYSDADAQTLREMDQPKNMRQLVEIGQAVARKVEEGHFPPAFDLR